MKPEFMNSLILAYLGDAIFEVIVREYLIVEKNIQKPDLLQKEAVLFVSAKAQAAFMNQALKEEWLSEKEVSIYKRGRNTKNTRTLKNTSIMTHNQSTGFEAIIGHLYLLDDYKRIYEIFDMYREFVYSTETNETII